MHEILIQNRRPMPNSKQQRWHHLCSGSTVFQEVSTTALEIKFHFLQNKSKLATIKLIIKFAYSTAVAIIYNELQLSLHILSDIYQVLFLNKKGTSNISQRLILTDWNTSHDQNMSSLKYLWELTIILFVNHSLL